LLLLLVGGFWCCYFVAVFQDIERTKAALEEADYAAVLEEHRRFLEGVNDA
jgi:hypothetical protein